ncbi:MAG TPA: DUF4389 domain-containing protein [Kofleriaceae bacterium]|jgi:hypothetical protein|nr:DUF4389 domain-containing protein [Kofleriaceae bacterium]
MTDYPVQLEVTPPAHFARIQLLLRIAFAIVLGFLGITNRWLAGLVFFGLPVAAAIMVSAYGAVRYHQDIGLRMWRVVAWLFELSAYMMILVDRFPVGHDPQVRLQLRTTGTPTVGSSLMRLLTSIPSAVALCLLGIVSGFITLVSAILVLVGAPIPAGCLGFQRGVLRWQARLLAYHASLVEEYPPFALDTEETSTPLRTDEAAV